MSLLAGVSTVDITPPVGAWLAGFAARNKPSEGVHDPLRARALVLDDGQTRLALLTNDLIHLGYETVDELKALLQQECGLPPERVMVNCSHTHSGPVTGGRGGDRLHESWLQTTVFKLVGAVRMAISNLQPARLGVAREPVQIGINRRERTPEGGTILGRNPDLPVAPYVDVFRLDSPAGAPRAILFSHACHPVTMAYRNYLISADYPGKAQTVVEAVFSGAQAAFAQGCLGNVNSEPVGGEFTDVDRLGTILAGAVIKAAARVETVAEVRLRAALAPGDIPLQEPPSVEEAAAALQAEQEKLAQARASGDEQAAKRQEAAVAWAERMARLAAGDRAPKMRFDVQGFAFNDAAVVGLPGEVFVEYQLGIEAASPFGHTTVLSVTNGRPAYIPTAAEMPWGGYEVVESMRWGATTEVSPAAEQVIFDRAAEVLAALV